LRALPVVNVVVVTVGDVAALIDKLAQASIMPLLLQGSWDPKNFNAIPKDIPSLLVVVDFEDVTPFKGPLL